MSGFFAGGRFWDMAAADRAVLDQGQAQLAAAGVGDPGHESRLIWAHVAGDSAAFAALVARRAARAPLSHLLGYRDFYDHRFIVTPDVLDPRPDTEAIVAAALALRRLLTKTILVYVFGSIKGEMTAQKTRKMVGGLKHTASPRRSG